MSNFGITPADVLAFIKESNPEALGHIEEMTARADAFFKEHGNPLFIVIEGMGGTVRYMTRSYRDAFIQIGVSMFFAHVLKANVTSADAAPQAKTAALAFGSTLMEVIPAKGVGKELSNSMQMNKEYLQMDKTAPSAYTMICCNESSPIYPHQEDVGLKTPDGYCFSGGVMKESQADKTDIEAYREASDLLTGIAYAYAQVAASIADDRFSQRLKEQSKEPEGIVLGTTLLANWIDYDSVAAVDLSDFSDGNAVKTIFKHFEETLRRSPLDLVCEESHSRAQEEAVQERETATIH